VKERRAMVEPEAGLSIRRQCEALGIHRSGVYYAAGATSDEDLELMRRIDELHLELPFLGSRKLSQELRAEGRVVNRKRVQRLMQRMGIVALAPQPQTSAPAPEHVKYPYLLRGLRVDRVNHVWSADITYIPLAHGFVYLVAIMDWYSRRVLAWRLSNTIESSFCVDALEEALANYPSPQIFNTDQGAQFTAKAFTDVLRERGIQISMDGKGRWLGRVDDRRGGCRRWGVSVSGSFRHRAGVSFQSMAPFPVAAHRSVRADFPHTALFQDFMPSPSAGRSDSSAA
jgi:putative transposase